MVLILRCAPLSCANGIIMNSKEDRNESNHEYNFFLDKEIQKKLLDLADEEEHVDHQRIQSAYATRGRAMAKSDDMCCWNPETSFKLRKPEKNQSKPIQKDIPRWDPSRPPKEIQFLFKHYGDTRNYMDQYRLEHTYHFGPMGKDGTTVEIHTAKLTSSPLPDSNLKQPPPRLKSYPDLAHPHSANTQPPKVPSEPNILELAHKYKIAPNILRAAQEQQQKEPDFDTQSLTRSRTSSAASQNGLSRRKSGKIASIQPNKVPAIPLSPTGARGGSEKSSRKNSPVNGGAAFFHGKTMKHIPSNGYAIDSQAVGPAVTNSKSPRNVVQVSDASLKTVDLLSHNVTALDNKMWFDASGRAYVSLATRYDPVRK